MQTVLQDLRYYLRQTVSQGTEAISGRLIPSQIAITRSP